MSSAEVTSSLSPPPPPPPSPSPSFDDDDEEEEEELVMELESFNLSAAMDAQVLECCEEFGESACHVRNDHAIILSFAGHVDETSAALLGIDVDNDKVALDTSGRVNHGMGHKQLRLYAASFQRRHQGASLRQLFAAVCQRVRDCRRYCPLCDDELAPVRSQKVRLMPCSKDVCRMGFLELGVGCLLSQELRAAGPAVADLVLTLLYASPTFTFRHPKLSHALLESNIMSAADVVEQARQGEAALVHFLGVDVHQEMRSVFANLRADIEPTNEIDVPGLVAAFKLRTVDEDREAEFQRRLAGRTPVLAFHGSPLSNWLGILQEGLVNASDTKRMLHGAVHGAGVYVAKELGVSLSYCHARSVTWPHSRLRTRDDEIVNVFGVCQVVPGSFLVGNNGWCFVVENELDVVVRYLVVQRHTKETVKASKELLAYKCILPL